MRLPSALAAARDLAERWPARLSIAPETGLPVCIQSTRLAYEAFRMAGFLDVTPMACELVAMNNKARLSIEQDRDLAGACGIEVGSDAPTTVESVGGWKGHLILEHPTFLLDLTFAGVVHTLAAGKDFGLDVGAFCAEKNVDAELVDDVWTSVTESGNVIMYRPRPELGGWQTSDAWVYFDDMDRQAAGRLAFIIKRVSER